MSRFMRERRCLAGRLGAYRSPIPEAVDAKICPEDMGSASSLAFTSTSRHHDAHTGLGQCQRVQQPGSCDSVHVARARKPSVVLTARIPQNLEDWTFVFQEIFGGIGVPEHEVLFFTDRVRSV
jgi:hypothetical protein